VSASAVANLLDQLDAIGERGGNGDLQLPDGSRLAITNTKKILWPARKLTKGDLFRYYIRVAPYILPVVADRPLVMKRQPNGIRGQTFYQQRAPDQVPRGVRVETLPVDDEVPSRLIGGSLLTLLYMTQLAAISQDPWFSRVPALDSIDHVAIDLDPMPGVPFDKVLEVARWTHDELEHLDVVGFPKTSGSNGLHIYIPMPHGTPYDTGLIFCQIIATIVAGKHPAAATVERAVQARGRKVYVDYLQNIQGKTLACAYSARGSDYAGVATPLSWDEVHDGVEREDFSIETVPARIEEVGDLWAELLTARGANLRAVERYAETE
jgi:bifunctional non-homologous end joining protein LigD